MTNRSTKRALLLSALSLLLCVSMLVGSTFAWFTDSVTSAGNIIQSGTLDVTMEWADGTKAVPAADSTDWTDASAGPIFKYDLWEPGYTEVRHIKIANVGTLALKYQLNIVANGEVSELADVIDVYYADPAAQVADRTALVAENKIGTLTEVLANMSSSASGNLEAGQNHTITLALKMQEEAGNEYQNLAIGSDFSVQLLATQLTAETDSFDDQYDKMATIDDVDELMAALAEKNVEIAFGSDIVLEEPITIAADQKVKFDLNGHKLSGVSTATGTSTYMIEVDGELTVKNGTVTTKHTGADLAWSYCTAVFHMDFDGKLNIENATVENLGGTSMAYAIDITNVYDGDDSKLTVNNSVLKSSYIAVRVFNNGSGVHNVEIENSKLSGKYAFWVQYYADGDFSDAATAEARRANLNIDIYNNNNTFTCQEGKVGPILYGYDEYTYFNESGQKIVVSADNLADSLAKGEDVVLADDLSITGTVITTNGVTEAYGNKVGVAQYGGVFDGNGNTLTGTDYSTYLVVNHGGTIKNLTMDIGNRGIAIYSPTEDVFVDNVNICADVAYAINTLEHPTVSGIDLIVTNSKLGGWSSFAGLETASFTNCEFGYGCYYSSYPYNSLVKPYINTTFTDCAFAGGYYIDLSALEAGCKVTLKNCTLDGVKLTAENIGQYLVAEGDYVAGQTKLVVEKTGGGYMTAGDIADYIIFQ